ncbi:MAG: glutamate-cysteine ligase family protein [Methanolinea sp.]|nr:glutamate-cysteine ligase family protein [Methanolinea sp.]
MKTGTEHEYSINSADFVPLPCSDRILAGAGGTPYGEVPMAGATIGKELQKTVLEFVPAYPHRSIPVLESLVYSGIKEFSRRFSGRYTLLGLGMHPTLSPSRDLVWDHGDAAIYREYDRLFGIARHGWVNVQAFQVNLEYRSEGQLVRMFNRVRALMPFLVAVSAASPFVEGRLTGTLDSRLVYYMENQARIPEICDGIVTRPIASVDDYRGRLCLLYDLLREEGADALCEEWVASFGAIVRFSRPCIEIKVMDEQECVRSDMALCAFARALVRARDLPLEEDSDALRDLVAHAIRHGTAGLEDDLSRLYRRATGAATPGERHYLPLVGERIRGGCLAALLSRRYRETGDLPGIMRDLARCLAENRPYKGGEEE